MVERAPLGRKLEGSYERPNAVDEQGEPNLRQLAEDLWSRWVRFGRFLDQVVNRTNQTKGAPASSGVSIPTSGPVGEHETGQQGHITESAFAEHRPKVINHSSRS